MTYKLFTCLSVCLCLFVCVFVCLCVCVFACLQDLFDYLEIKTGLDTVNLSSVKHIWNIIFVEVTKCSVDVYHTLRQFLSPCM